MALIIKIAVATDMRGNPKSRVTKVPYHREESPARLKKVSAAGNVPIEKVPDAVKKFPLCWKSPRKSWKRSKSPSLKSSESPRQYPYYYYYPCEEVNFQDILFIYRWRETLSQF